MKLTGKHVSVGLFRKAVGIKFSSAFNGCVGMHMKGTHARPGSPEGVKNFQAAVSACKGKGKRRGGVRY
jgi:hypothetical protein